MRGGEEIASSFTTESTENTEIGREKENLDCPEFSSFLSDLRVLCVLCGERANFAPRGHGSVRLLRNPWVTCPGLAAIGCQVATEAGIARFQLQGSLGEGNGQLETALFGVDQRQVVHGRVVVGPEFDGLQVRALGLRIVSQFVVAQADVVQERGVG